MKKKICCLLSAGLMLLAASGCGSAFEAEYDYEEPVTGSFGTLSGNATEIRNYSMLKTALTDMISRREEQGEFRLSNYNGSPSEDLAAACYEIKSKNPLGNYAVESLSYDTSYVVSYYMANIYVSYQRTAEEIESIVYAGNQSEFDTLVCDAVDHFQPDAVIRIYSAAVDEAHISALIRQHYYDDPVSMAAEPAVRVESYPNEGANRIYSIRFDYAQPESQMNRMSRELAAALDAAVSELPEEEPPKLALEGAEWLSGLAAEAGEKDRGDTAYAAVVERCADSRGMALAYRALCRRLEIPCTVVEGSVGAMGAEPHFWNIIELDGEHYHVDVSAFDDRPAKAFLLSDDALWGTYIWETAAYPECSGGLTYADVAGLPEPTDARDSGETGGETPPEDEPGEETGEEPEETEESEEKSENMA